MLARGISLLVMVGVAALSAVCWSVVGNERSPDSLKANVSRAMRPSTVDSSTSSVSQLTVRLPMYGWTSVPGPSCSAASMSASRFVR